MTNRTYQSDMFKTVLLCKLKGMLVLAEFSYTTENQEGKCPVCKNTQFIDEHGWTTCNNCYDFAFLAKDI